MPMDLVKMRSSTFISEVIEPRKAQVQATTWTDDQINAIENDHRKLLTAYRREDGISSIVNQHDHTTSFNEAWDSLDGARFDQLRRFCAGLATVFPTSTSSPTFRFLNGSSTSSARVCWTYPWKESSRQNSSSCWIASGAF